MGNRPASDWSHKRPITSNNRAGGFLEGDRKPFFHDRPPVDHMPAKLVIMLLAKCPGMGQRPENAIPNAHSWPRLGLFRFCWGLLSNKSPEDRSRVVATRAVLVDRRVEVASPVRVGHATPLSLEFSVRAERWQWPLMVVAAFSATARVRADFAPPSGASAP